MVTRLRFALTALTLAVTAATAPATAQVSGTPGFRSEGARLAAMKPAGASEARLLADAIALDSQKWAFNRYDPGSLRNVLTGTDGGQLVLHGDYTFNDGSRGWVEGRVAGGQVESIRYWDSTSWAAVGSQGGDRSQTALAAPRGTSPIAAPPAAAASSRSEEYYSDTLPADFRGTITYSGRHQGEVITAPIKMRSSSSYKPRPGTTSAATGRTREYSGTFNIELKFDGQAVSGRYWGTGGINRGTVSGTRTGTRCRIVDDGDGSVTEAQCSRTRYYAEINSSSGRDTTISLLDAQATQFVDARVEEEKQRVARAEAEERARKAAEAYAALPNAGTALTRQLDGFVTTDSRGWAFNQYDTGSMREVKIIDGTAKSGNFAMQGSYTYNGGSRGWVMAKMAGGKLECIQFWDSVIGCRGLRTPEQGQAMRSAAFDVLAGGNGTAGSPSAGAQGEQDLEASRLQRESYDRQFPAPPAAAPVAPIAPWYDKGPGS